MSINDATGVSPSLQVAADLRRKIAQGELTVGDKLPTARELADQYGVALTTAVRATDELHRDGLIEKRRNKGSFVAQAPQVVELASDRYQRGPARQASVSNDPFDRVDAETWTEVATPRIAKRLGIEPGQEVSVVRYIWHVQGQPVQWSMQWEPLTLTRGTAIEKPADGTKGSPSVAERFRSIGIQVDRITEKSWPRMPSIEDSKILRMGPGVPVVEIERTHWADALAVETADIVIRGDRLVMTTVHNL
ncbi:GntR family transcriptional regulator [Amycolatopsis thermoflava]|uniref:GntR family transcriptional regulator n=1 Tax=Amycolatopsis thermoflava TaxID=84480 RepID=UPI003D738261